MPSISILNNGYFVGGVLHHTGEDWYLPSEVFHHCFGCVLGTCGYRPRDAPSSFRRIILSGSYVADDFDRAVRPSTACRPCSSATSHAAFETSVVLAVHGHHGGARRRLCSCGVLFIDACFCDVMIGDGMMETSPYCSACDGRPDRRGASTVGPNGTHMSKRKIIDPQTAAWRRGTRAKLGTRGRRWSCWATWVTRPRPRAPPTPRWMHTGDLGYDERRRIRQHRSYRRHDHPRRREHLSARSRSSSTCTEDHVGIRDRRARRA